MHFKNRVRSMGVKLYPDEVMDPFRNNDSDSKGNAGFRYAFGQLFNAAFTVDVGKLDNLAEHPDTPPLLIVALKQTRKQALKYGG